MRDVIFHTQWCALLATVAVEWPQFVCTSSPSTRSIFVITSIRRPTPDTNRLVDAIV